MTAIHLFQQVTNRTILFKSSPFHPNQFVSLSHSSGPDVFSVWPNLWDIAMWLIWYVRRRKTKDGNCHELFLGVLLYWLPKNVGMALNLTKVQGYFHCGLWQQWNAIRKWWQRLHLIQHLSRLHGFIYEENTHDEGCHYPVFPSHERKNKKVGTRERTRR